MGNTRDLFKKIGDTKRTLHAKMGTIKYTNHKDLTDRVPDELWNEVHDTTGDRDQDHPHGKERQKSKMAVLGSLTNSLEKKRR